MVLQRENHGQPALLMVDLLFIGERRKIVPTEMTSKILTFSYLDFVILAQRMFT